MISLKACAIAAAGVLAAGAPASAVTLTYTEYSQASGPASMTGPAQQIVPAAQTNASETFNIPLFDSTSGTLNSITLQLSSNLSVIAQVTNIGGSDANYTQSFATQPFTLSDTLGTLLTSSIAAGPGAGTVGAHQTVTSATNSQLYSNSVGLDNSEFTTYSSSGGGGTVSVNFALGTIQASGNGISGQTFFGGNGNADATLSVTYDYTPPPTPPDTPVPEPTTMAILGIGLLGAGVARRLRRG